jgi:hypothetical protein
MSNAPDPNVEGGCLCGAVRYAVSGRAIVATLCHCRSCRLAAGAPSVAWVVLHSADLTFTTGAPVRFESSPGTWRAFCRQCGTSLTFQRESEPETIDVTTASLDRPNDFAPTKEIWLDHKLAWESANGSIPQHPRSSRPIQPSSSIDADEAGARSDGE